MLGVEILKKKKKKIEGVCYDSNYAIPVRMASLTCAMRGQKKKKVLLEVLKKKETGKPGNTNTTVASSGNQGGKNEKKKKRGERKKNTETGIHTLFHLRKNPITDKSNILSVKVKYDTKEK